MFLSKDKTKEISPEEIFDNYCFVVKHGGPVRKAGDNIVRTKEVIYGICDSCGENFQNRYKTLMARDFRCLCKTCAERKTKEDKYGKPTYNNPEKRLDTNLRTYGKGNLTPKGLNKGRPKSQETKDKISRLAKERLSDPKNHPFYGRRHSQESKEKNRQTQLRLIEEGKRPLGVGNYKTGSIYSDKLQRDVTYRSSYEKNFIYVLENIYNLEYDIESVVIPYSFDGEDRRYIVDFYVRYEGTEYLIEIKPERLSKREKNVAKKNAAKRYAKEQGMKYAMLSEGDMNRFPFIIGAHKDFTPHYLSVLSEAVKQISTE